MASLASLVTLGSSGASSSSGYHEMVLSLVNKGSVPRGVCCCSFRHLGKGKRWRYVSVCRSSVITDYRSEQGNPGAVGNAFKGTNNGDADFILKPAPKPSLTPPSRPERPSSANSARDLSNSNVNSRVGSSNDMGERKKVIDTLDEVLEKAEKLEISNSQQVNARAENKTAYKPSPVASTTGRGSGNVGNSPDSRKTKAAKSVWRKGNPVSNVPPVNTAPPVVIKGRNPEPMTEPNIGVNGGLQSQAPPPSRPSLPPEKPEYTLQARPSVAPPPPPPPKKSVILKDKGAAQKLPNADGKERKQPILVDKFATKKPAADPQAAQAVIAPAKPSKVVTGKFRDDYRKRGGPAGGARRRIKGDEDLEDASELNVSIPGAASRRKGRKFNRASRKAARLQAARDAAPVRVEILEVGEDGMSTEELAHHLAIGHGQIFGYLYSKGIRPDGVQTLDKSMVKMICNEYGVEVIDKDPFKIEDMAVKKEFLDEEDLDKLVDRPPVITIMGHVDHGKTTLLDHIRKTKVVASEAGGITQGIGAYKVQVPVDGKIRNCVFLDTPGHAAFGAMRARGAKVTDICVIVVAADDGIRPQTNEAIAHARAADVPIVIGLNKIDKDGASPERVMQELSNIGLLPEEWGGDIPVVQISALKGENVDDLLETIMLVAELQELKANPERDAKGTVIEAGLHKSKGPVATFIVQNGTLKQGDLVVCGEAYGKVRALFDDRGNRVDEAGPSMPVQVIGLHNVPRAGDEFEVVSTLDVAREKAEACAETLKKEHMAAKAGDGKVTLSSLASAIASRSVSGLDLHQLNIILKVDVQGTMEAIRQALQVLPQDNVTLKFILQATGDVSTSDIDLASATKAIVVGFNVKAPGPVKSYADNKGIEIRLYRVIYEIIDDIRNAMEGLLDAVQEEIPIGSAEVRAVFSSGSGRVAGCMVTDGKVVKECGIRVMRKRKPVHVGVLGSLRRVKEAVDEVGAGLECGIGMDDYDDWKEGDIIEAFNTVEKKRTLEEASASMAAVIDGAGYSR